MMVDIANTCLGDELRHRALPTFTNLLHTLAPPISAHERLRIHTTHDLVGYPSLDPLIHGVFSRVMAQVEGGDLLVVQRGHESQSARASSVAGWRDGPWWRQVDGQPPRDLGVVRGLVEGTKLARANAEAYAHEFFAAEGGIEEARRRAAEPLSESVPVRCSDIFLAVQAVGVDADKSLFAGSSSSAEKEDRDANAFDQDEELVLFAVYLLDPVHDIAYSSVGQGIPARWTRWLDAGTASPLTPASSGAPTATSEPEDDDDTAGSHFSNVPEEIRDIVESGGVDPREWVAEWLEEALQLTVGIAAQRYVARRMGVGLSAAGEEAEIKGKRKADVSNGAGEAARAGLI